MFNQKIGAVVAGRYTPVVFKKDYKTRMGSFVTKVTHMVTRLGIKATNLKHYEHKGNGLKGDDKWLAYPFLIDGRNGKKIRLFVTYNEAQRARSDWYVTDESGNTRPTTKEEALEKGWLVPSDIKSYGEINMFDVFLDNIIQIGK